MAKNDKYFTRSLHPHLSSTSPLLDFRLCRFHTPATVTVMAPAANAASQYDDGGMDDGLELEEGIVV